MGKKTGIEWTNRTWNPVTGCIKVSEACVNCYAERMHKRQQAMGNYDTPFNVIQCHPKRLDEPHRWRKSQKVFVCSMSDLFGEGVPDEFIMQVLRTIETVAFESRLRRGSPIIFQLLTKRPERMQMMIEWLFDEYRNCLRTVPHMRGIWLGVTAESTARWYERVPVLLKTPGAVRFVSVEPMLEKIEKPIGLAKLDWVIVGGESGKGARPMSPDWVADIQNQCERFDVRLFFKQWGTHPLRKHLMINPAFKQFPKGSNL